MKKTPSAVASAPLPEGAPAPDPAVQVLRQFRVVFNAVRTHFQQMEKQTGVGGAQVWALSEIQRQPGLGMNGLARAMDIHQSTASNLVRLLVKRGMVRMEKSTVDRRSVHLYLEAAALDVLKAVPGPSQGVLPEALRQLPPATLAQLSAGLSQLIPALHADESAGSIPLADL
ncbi:MAG: MarR family transcriptional regulator [Polaromonas sp.]|nr:MarR family transcriptional regulator [Polaromonas sp.]